MAASSFFPPSQAGFNPLAGFTNPQTSNMGANMGMNPLFNPYSLGGISPFINNANLQANIDEVTYKSQLK